MCNAGRTRFGGYLSEIRDDQVYDSCDVFELYAIDCERVLLD